jgi:hypothetical protein
MAPGVNVESKAIASPTRPRHSVESPAELARSSLLILRTDDGIVVVQRRLPRRGGREGEMWEVDRALTENTRFTQLERGRWKAEYSGFVTMTAEGDTPTESERQLSRAMDVLLASLIRGGKDRDKPDTVAVISSSMLTDAITVVDNTAKKTKKFKQDGRRRADSAMPPAQK